MQQRKRAVITPAYTTITSSLSSHQPPKAKPKVNESQFLLLCAYEPCASHKACNLADDFVYAFLFYVKAQKPLLCCFRSSTLWTFFCFAPGMPLSWPECLAGLVNWTNASCKLNAHSVNSKHILKWYKQKTSTFYVLTKCSAACHLISTPALKQDQP